MDCFRLSKPLWHIKLPQGFKYTSAALANNIYHGLLHIFMRNSFELEPHIPGLRSLRLQLAYSTRTILRRIGQKSNMEAAEIDVQQFFSHLTSEYATLIEAQRLVQKFLQRVVMSTAAVNITKSDGSTKLEYKLPSGTKSLVIIVSDWVDPPLRNSYDKRNAQKIITAYTAR